jgi:hypothetical protein
MVSEASSNNLSGQSSTQFPPLSCNKTASIVVEVDDDGGKWLSLVDPTTATATAAVAVAATAAAVIADQESGPFTISRNSDLGMSLAGTITTKFTEEPEGLSQDGRRASQSVASVLTDMTPRIQLQQQQQQQEGVTVNNGSEDNGEGNRRARTHKHVTHTRARVVYTTCAEISLSCLF